MMRCAVRSFGLNSAGGCRYVELSFFTSYGLFAPGVGGGVTCVGSVGRLARNVESVGGEVMFGWALIGAGVPPFCWMTVVPGGAT